MAINERITLSRDCKVNIIPSGETMILAADAQVWIVQELGGSYTVMTETGHAVRIDNLDADALGKEIMPPPDSTETAVEGSLRFDQTCYFFFCSAPCVRTSGGATNM